MDIYFIDILSIFYIYCVDNILVDICIILYNIDFILERGKWYSGQVNIKHLIQYIRKEVEVAYLHTRFSDYYITDVIASVVASRG